MLAMRTGTGARTPERPASRAVDFSPERVAAAVVAQDAPSAPTGADTTADEYMRPTGGGTYEYEHPGFKGTIARDGSVTFKDTPAVSVDWGLPCVKCISEDFEKWKQDPYGGHTVNLTGLLPVFRIGFDITDWAERLAGNDPYSYEKNKFLEATRERRAAMSAEETRDATRAALLALPEYLAAVWAYEQWSTDKRRRVLFELWDECAESEAGARARATILGFVRRKVDEPYSEDELAALNRGRTSTEEFAPYTNAEPRE